MTRMLQLGLILFVAVLSGCDMLGFHEWQWHQKLTVSVDTPDGLKIGSSVTEVRLGLSPRWWGLGDSAGSGHSSLSGEAVVVDLGNGRYLFALLKGYGHETAQNAFANLIPKPVSRETSIDTYDALQALRATIALDPALYPLLVTFDDINEPASVQRVEPYNLTATFGQGYRLNSIAMAITEEPVTKGSVEATLGWLAAVGRERPTLIPNPPRLAKDATDPDIQYLTPGPFSTELYK